MGDFYAFVFQIFPIEQIYYVIRTSSLLKVGMNT